MLDTRSSILSNVHNFRRSSFKALSILACLSLSLIPGLFLNQKIVQAEELSSPQMMGDSLDVQIISAGGRHSCGIKPDNSIECWGDNDQEQLNVPDPNASFQQSSAGGEHSCGLKNDGSIVCWGENASGQTTVPTPNSDFIQVSAGTDHSCGLKNDGSLICWGDNSSGQRTVPTPNSNWSQVSAGRDHSCGFYTDDSLVCWGDNTTGESIIPPPNQDWAQISLGVDFSCGLKKDGTLYCWGENGYGQTTVPSPNSDYSLVSAGDDHVCAKKTDSSLVCWGRNNQGQLDIPAPNINFGQVSAGATHSCGLKIDGSFACWGNDTFGQVDPNYFTHVSAGVGHTCALTKGDSAKCWGGMYNNLNGEGTIRYPNNDYYDISAGFISTCGLKNDQTLHCWPGDIAAIPPPNTNWFRVSAGSGVCAMRNTDFSMTCWGVFAIPSGTTPGPFNFFSDYPISAGYNHTCAVHAAAGQPVECWTAPPNPPLGLPSPNANFWDVSVGSDFACGTRSGGEIICWGNNSFGQILVPLPNSNWNFVSAGARHACGTKSSGPGNITCWGDNTHGQSSVPAPNAGFRVMDAGFLHTCGIKNDGRLLCWGNNDEGQIDVPHLDTLKSLSTLNLFPPFAVDDSYTTQEDTTLSVDSASGVLANDHDLDGFSITAHKDSDPTRGTVSLATDGSFTYTPTADLCGPDSFTYHAEDSTYSSNTATVNITVNCENDPPTFSDPGLATYYEDDPAVQIDLWPYFSDLEDTDLQLSFALQNNSNPLLFTPTSISSDRYLNLAFAPDGCGTGTITVRATDTGYLSIDGDLDINVTCVNDQPDLSASDPPAITEDTPLQTINNWASFDPGPPNESGQTVLAYTVSGISNPGLFSQAPAVNQAGTLTYQPAPNLNGSSTFDIQVQDDGGTASGGDDTSPVHTFTILVNPDNDPPTFTGPGLAIYYEDDPAVQIDLWPYFSDLEDTDLQLSFALQNNSNPLLFTPVSISSDRYLDLAFAPDGFGTGTITVRATDSGALSIDGNLDYEIIPVNDAPSFAPGGDITLPMNSGSYSASWAGSISPGPANESGQSVAFSVSNDNNALFIVQPNLSPTGILSFTLVSGMTGSAQVSASLADDGGTAFGGIDTSPTEVFTITVAPFPVVTLVQAEDGSGIAPGSTVIDRINDLSIQFDLVLDDPAGDADPDDVTNPANYLLVESGPNGLLETTSCAAGLSGDDLNIVVDWVSYPIGGTTARIFVNGASPLPSGEYRLLVCGSTSITAGSIPLAGDGVNSGTDYRLDFIVILPATLPDTGYPPGKLSHPISIPPPAIPNNAAGLTLEIPRLDISLPITSIPFRDSDWDISWLTYQAGWLEGTSFPTWAGNSVLTSHVVNANGLPGPFADLHRLRYGDQIIIRAWGQHYIYTVQSVQSLNPWDTSAVFQHEDYPTITLLTCADYYSPLETYSTRIMIKAVQVAIR